MSRTLKKRVEAAVGEFFAEKLGAIAKPLTRGQCSRELFAAARRTCELSECGNYRYSLGVVWDERKPIIAFDLLNPSKATADVHDPTLLKCIGYTDRAGGGGLYVVNPYAYRSTDPRTLLAVADPVGPDNDRHRRRVMECAAYVVCGWGTGIDSPRPGTERRELGLIAAWSGREPRALAVTKGGHPKHPSRLAYSLPLRPYSELQAELRTVGAMTTSCDNSTRIER